MRQRTRPPTIPTYGTAPEAPGDCRDIDFDPLVLPDGIAPSDDPLLSARSAASSQSFTRRSGGAKPPFAVTGASPHGAAL